MESSEKNATVKAQIFKESMVGRNASIVAMLPISFAIGLCSHEDFTLGLCVGVIALFTNYMFFLRCAAITWGSQGLLTKQTALHLFLALVSFLVGGVPWAATYRSSHEPGLDLVWKASNVFLVVLPSGLVILAGARTFPVVGVAACLIRGFAPELVFDDEVRDEQKWTAVITAALLFPVGLTKYRTEECALAFMPLVIATAIYTGAHWGVSVKEALWMSLSILAAYLQILWMRRKRVMPPSLRGCKFVTLSYFRQIAASGEGIRRCQDLPPEAFGDPRKAKYLIVLSHRWMNRFTCDVKTAECPEGLRLHMLLKHLESVFSTAGIGQGKGFLDKFRRFRYATTGGSDVLVFMDFMSLPQVGKSKDGTLLKRTDREMKTFEQCLPSMGLLYSMFPVMVSPEVTEDCSGYLDSGWCFSESSTAWLGGQLSLFPGNLAVRQWLDAETSKEDDLPTVGRKLDRILTKKAFLYNTDRTISRTMIGGFVLKCRLADAVQTKSVPKLETALEDLMEGGFDSIVNQPVDAALNTPLHLAVRLNFKKGVQLLLEAGADKYVRNLYGDSPVQYFLFPCLRGAAKLCRRLSSSVLAAERSQDSFSKFACHYNLSSAFGENSTSGSFVDSPTSSPMNTFCMESFPDDLLHQIGVDDDNRRKALRRIVSLDGERFAVDVDPGSAETEEPSDEVVDVAAMNTHLESL